MELEKTWGRAASIWWLLLWRGLLGGMVVGAIIGFFIGIVGTMLGHPQETLVATTQLVVAPIAFGWGFIVLRMGLRKKYRDFRIVLVPRDSDNAEIFS
jgi:hypothetical protein